MDRGHRLMTTRRVCMKTNLYRKGAVYITPHVLGRNKLLVGRGHFGCFKLFHKKRD